MKTYVKLTPANFFDWVDKTGSCWIWKRYKAKNGYGMVRYNGKAWYSHRVSYLFAKGPIPDGMFVCHKCDNPSCVNPDHLFLGTVQDNSTDSVNKGRSARGEAIKQSKLTEKQVLELREEFIPWQKGCGAALAAKYGISKRHVQFVASGGWKNRISWKYIKEAASVQ